MTSHKTALLCRLAAVLAVTAVAAGCNTVSRLSEVGQEPSLSTISNPTARPNYKPVSLPMPAPEKPEVNPNSLWRPGARAFFKDQRAKEVGDILTVTVDLKDSADMANQTNEARDDSENANMTNFLGLEAELGKYLNDNVDPSSLAAFGSTHSTSGDGSIKRSEDIQMSLAAVVTQVLPNGNLVILGRQELRVNYELRELMVTGVIRPQDIDPDNTISHDKIAEMRFAYGGRGTLSDLQQPRWGTQLWDILFPF